MKTLIPSVSLGLLLGLALGPAWGQPQRQQTVEAPGHEPSAKPRAVAPDIPVDDFDREAKTMGPQLVPHLKIILDRQSRQREQPEILLRGVAISQALLLV
jgi:hypothetical protein